MSWDVTVSGAGSAGPEPIEPDSLFDGPGEVRALCRAIDWAATPLGAVPGWPVSLRTLVTSLLASPHPMLLWWGPELVEIHNDAFRSRMGGSRTQPCRPGMRAADCWRDSWLDVAREIERALRGQGTWHEDRRVRLERAGRAEDAFWSFGSGPVFDDEGRVAGVLLVGQETTARVRARLECEAARQEAERLYQLERQGVESLRRSEERERLLFERSPIAKWVFDLETLRFLSVNEAAVRRYGWSREEFGAMTVTELLAGLVEPGADARALAIRSGPARHRHRDGTWADVEVSVVELELDGRPSGVAAVLDVTERSRIERALRESEERFHALADNIPQLAWMADASGWLLWYNQRWYEYTGTTPEAMEGWGWQSVHHPDHVERVVAHFRASIESGEAWEDTFPLRSRTGEYRWFLSRALPIRDEAGHVVRWFGTNTDVTRQLETEDALRRAKEEAETANRAKSEFLAAMSHELRTPLNAISGYVDLLEIGVHGPLTAPQLASLERIRISGVHLLKLINDVLHFTKLETSHAGFETRALGVADLLAAVKPLVEPQIERKGLRCEFGHADPGLEVRADRERVLQILLNLLGNAVKFTNAGGDIRVSCEADAERVRLHVADTGRGIPTGRLESIFDPFVQLERHHVESSHQGVGLGLSISRDLARGMAGDLTVASTLGAGSTFTLDLPRHR